ncbi:hypothetical protein QJS04_geneDACA005734 [Acorus gramineus]|uniref:Uncharacterized protein n=1 Tax=Acorus gramineus TaxID=55184 RepID=A0AAV9BKE0_ACOGR|nr:hypothetical protein QJS04_geneDACA005734 [Acorus gramineus]
MTGLPSHAPLLQTPQILSQTRPPHHLRLHPQKPLSPKPKPLPKYHLRRPPLLSQMWGELYSNHPSFWQKTSPSTLCFTFY